ncbi:MAG: Lrp/AsnC family transcriptional regulator [Syntrophobacterales bacterium]|jgi:DNA-binding Lrp family transcriptional regulator|nr:Lrp/AsnC family transcriptional regulator [Syntrophobacterales bacterium]
MPDERLLDDMDRRILNRIQQRFPVTAEPFRVLAEEMNISEEEALHRVRVLKERGVIRRIGAVFSPHHLGFVSTLCAVKVPPAKVAHFTETINAVSGVTHHYQRNHAYNYWFTLICPSEEELVQTLKDIEKQTALPILSMRSTKTFKINASFSL